MKLPSWLLIPAAIALALMVLMVQRRGPSTSQGFLTRPAPSLLRSGGNYVGNAACMECHPSETAYHAGSGHARTLRLAVERRLADDLFGKSLPDPEQADATWSYTKRDGRFWVQHAEAGASQMMPVDYAFGSGHHAVTWLSVIDGADSPTAREHRLTYYAHRADLGLTPGQDEPTRKEGTDRLGRVLDRAATRKCFSCHVTALSVDDPQGFDVSRMIGSVGCERCHGPGADHVELARSGAAAEKLVMPGGLGRSADDELLLCGECHRHPKNAGPGVIRTDNRELARFQPVGLMQSACYRKGEGRLRCSTCHDPHRSASTDQILYNSLCIDCHRAPERPCPISPDSKCVDCHMPKRDAGQGILFTDHWIRVP